MTSERRPRCHAPRRQSGGAAGRKGRPGSGAARRKVRSTKRPGSARPRGHLHQVAAAGGREERRPLPRSDVVRRPPASVAGDPPEHGDGESAPSTGPRIGLTPGAGSRSVPDRRAQGDGRTRTGRCRRGSRRPSSRTVAGTPEFHRVAIVVGRSTGRRPPRSGSARSASARVVMAHHGRRRRAVNDCGPRDSEVTARSPTACGAWLPREQRGGGLAGDVHQGRRGDAERHHGHGAEGTDSEHGRGRQSSARACCRGHRTTSPAAPAGGTPGSDAANGSDDGQPGQAPLHRRAEEHELADEPGERREPASKAWRRGDHAHHRAGAPVPGSADSRPSSTSRSRMTRLGRQVIAA